jgi:hypothetical protein
MDLSSYTHKRAVDTDAELTKRLLVVDASLFDRDDTLGRE